MEKIFTQAIDTIFKKPILLVPMAIPAVFAMAFAGKIFIDFWRSGFDIYYFANFDISHLIYAVIILFLIYIFFLLMEGIMIYDFTLRGNIEIKEIFGNIFTFFDILYHCDTSFLPPGCSWNLWDHSNVCRHLFCSTLHIPHNVLYFAFNCRR
jgi:hypothetical protein